MTVPVLEVSDSFVNALLGHVADRTVTGHAAIDRMRADAIAQLLELRMPTTRDERWRFSDLEALKQVDFGPTREDASVLLAELQAFLQPAAARMVFIDGRFSSELSDLHLLPPEVVACSLRAVSEFESVSGEILDVFAALNALFFEDGAFVAVPAGLKCEVPLHLLFVARATGAATASHPRCLLKAARNSSLTVFEEYVSLGSDVAWTNALTEVELGEGAHVSHLKLQRENRASFHLGRTFVVQDRDSAYQATTLTLGAAFSRQEPLIRQVGEGAESTLSGLAMVSGKQLADTHSTVEHTKPHGTSRQLHKCVVDGQARVVFNGQIMVAKNAQQIDSRQASRTLLLSDDARVDSSPQLLIFADDVKCAHGATVGPLDPEELFYLESRGLGEREARNLLTYAFAAEVLESVPIPFLKQHLQRLAFALVPDSEGRSS